MRLVSRQEMKIITQNQHNLVYTAITPEILWDLEVQP